MEKFLPLETPRLVLRRLRASDLAQFLAYRNDPEVARYQSWDSYTRAEAEQFISRQERQEPGAPGEWLQIAIASNQCDELVGDCALKVHADDTRQATIGVTLSRSFQGKGLATEALSALLCAAFDRMKLHRVVADTDPQNAPAWRLLERLGMRREAHRKQSLWFKGRWADEYLYALLGTEWAESRRRTR